jgi:hypothetical protein
MVSLLLCQAITVIADEVFLTGMSDPTHNISKRYVADSDHIHNTPSWTVGEPSPLDQEKLLSLLHEKYPKLTNESIYGFKLNRVANIVANDGTPIKFDRKWSYTVLWMKKDRLTWTIVLLDGTIVEPQITPYKK